MFTWICPQCGREVPPAYNECPDCAKNPSGEAEAAGPVQPPAALPQAVVPPVAYAQPPAPVRQRAAARAPLPTWLLTVLFAFAFLGMGAGVYWAVGYFRAAGAPAAIVESPAAKPGASVSPFQKYIEISGVRFTENARKKLEVKYLITNHSGAEIAGLAGNVTIWGRTQRSEEDAAGSFAFSTDLHPFESKELVAALNTKHAAIELPDWQNISTDVQITAPTTAPPGATIAH